MLIDMFFRVCSDIEQEESRVVLELNCIFLILVLFIHSRRY
jgi:hypothetical protein